MEDIISKIKLDTHCGICYEPFIDIYKYVSKGEDFYDFLKKIKEEISPEISRSFDNEYCCKEFDERFECLVCKNMVCRSCIWSFVLKIKPIQHIRNHITDDYTDYVDGIQGEDGPISCPFCRTKDYREYYYPNFCKLPQDLLYEIKSIHLK